MVTPEQNSLTDLTKQYLLLIEQLIRSSMFESFYWVQLVREFLILKVFKGENMSVVFDGAGLKAEQLAAKQFNGKLVTDLQLQYKDIDVFIPAKDGSVKSVSVKDQKWSSNKFKAVQVELECENTRTGATVDGCFPKNESDYYLWRVTVDGKDSWAVILSSKLQEFVYGNLERLKNYRTTARVEEKNRSYGRTYDRTRGKIIPLTELVKLGTIIPVRGT